MRYASTAALVAAALALVVPARSFGADAPVLLLSTDVAPLRDKLGSPLLDTVVELNNGSRFILERLTPQGATFAAIGYKVPGEPFDDLRKRSNYSLSFTTCSGSKGLDGKIASVIAWEAVPNERGAQASQNFTASYLQQLLEAMNTPPAVTSPSTIRTPRSTTLNGIVFEYVKGDTTETLSLLDDLAVDPSRALYFSWQAANRSFCPKE